MPPHEPFCESFRDIDAQDVAVDTLSRALASDRLAGAYLFVGPSGVGKQRAALALARARICVTELAGAPACECSACHRIATGQHPDVRVFSPRAEGNRNLQVETIREEIRPFTQFAPFEARTAFLVFPDADVSFPPHHAEAANALLKTLEEPRPNLVFVMLSSRPTRLLPTIRSRCQQVRFGPLSRATLQAILARHGIDAGDRDAAIALADGRADRALDLARDGRSELMLEWAMRIDQTTAGGRVAERLDLAEELARHEDRDVILETLCMYYRDVAASGLGQRDALRFAQKADAITARAGVLSPGQAAGRVARIEELGEQLVRNANPEIALDALLFALQ